MRRIGFHIQGTVCFLAFCYSLFSFDHRHPIRATILFIAALVMLIGLVRHGRFE